MSDLSRIRLVFLTRSLQRGGAEGQMVTLAGLLDRDVFDVSVCAIYGGGPLREVLEDASIPVYVVGKRGRWDGAEFLLRTVMVLRRFDPDILHSYMVLANITAALTAPLLPGAHIVWGIRGSAIDLSPYPRSFRLFARLERALARRAHLIIANSYRGRDDYVAMGYPRERMAVVPNGIDTSWFRPSRAEGRALRRQWGVRDDEALIGLVGVLDPVKDQMSFLRAASLLASERSNTRFVCVGPTPRGSGRGHYADALQSLSRELRLDSRLIWAGERTDMPAVYSALDLATSASASEGFPNCVAEAMACGTPCVVTNVGDSAAIVGKSEWVVPAGDATALAAAWNCVLAGLPETAPSIRRSVRRRITTCFSLEALRRETERHLIAIAHPRANSPGSP